MDIKDKATAMVLASFGADSLALGVHWIYDTEMIRRDFGRVDDLLKPAPGSYHATRGRGAFTHYGDQAFVLLESLAARKGFDPADFSMRWRALFRDYDGYHDKATKETLRNLSLGVPPEEAGSRSEDLAGASRIAPLVYCCRDDLDSLIDGARAQTRMTHNAPLVVESAEFFARVSRLVLEGRSPVSAMEEVARRNFPASPLSEWVMRGIRSREEESLSAILGFGQSCHQEEAFPATVHLIARYEEDLEEALVQSVMAGGDSSARGMAAGMVLGAHLGPGGIPERWISGLARREEILKLLDRMTAADR